MTFLFLFSEKIRLGISCESSARQMINLKCQKLFSLKKIQRKKKELSFVAGIIVLLELNGIRHLLNFFFFYTKH